MGDVVGAIAGSLIQGRATRRAAEIQADSADRATQLQREMFEQSRADQQPWMQGGQNALAQLLQRLGVYSGPQSVEDLGSIQERLREDLAASGLRGDRLEERARILARAEQENQRRNIRVQQRAQRGAEGFGSLLDEFTGEDLENDPGYQFRLNQGNQALDRSAAARGGLYSGNQLRALGRYNQDFASTEFTNAFNRDRTDRNNIFNMLSGVAGTGQASTNLVGQQGMNFGQQAGNNAIGAGNARASGYLAQGNNWGNAINSTIAAGNRNNWWQSPQQQSWQPSQAWWQGGDGFEGE